MVYWGVLAIERLKTRVFCTEFDGVHHESLHVTTPKQGIERSFRFWYRNGDPPSSPYKGTRACLTFPFAEHGIMREQVTDKIGPVCVDSVEKGVFRGEERCVV